MAVLVAYRIKINESSLLAPNLPIATVLDLLIVVWIGYGLSMLVYFSDDLFQPFWRKEALYWGLSCLFELPIVILSIAAYAVLTNDLTIYLPQPYPLIVAFIVFLGLSWIVRFRLGRKIDRAYLEGRLE